MIHARFRWALTSAAVALLVFLGASFTAAGEEEWSLQRIVPYDIDLFKDVHILPDGQTGWLAGYIQYSRTHSGSAVLRTVDGGRSWTEQEIGISTVVEAIAFIDETTGWLVGTKGVIAKTTDGGITWQLQTSNTESRLRDVFFVDDTTGWAVGDNTILFTFNGGELWQGAGTRYTAQFNALSFSSRTTGWIVGKSGIMYQTADGGSTWTVLTSPTAEDLSNIFFLNAQTGWISGKNGTILSTKNGGITWDSRASGTQQWLSDIYFTDTNRGWSVGSLGTVLQTLDGGLSWIPVVLPTSATLNAVHITPQGDGWICGAGGVCFRTKDLGNSWQYELQGPNANLTDVEFVDSKYGWSCGWNGTLLQTTNGGQDWFARRCGVDALLIGVDFIDRLNGCLVTFEGGILRSTDGGASWSALPSPAGTFRELDLPEPEHVWIVGEHGGLAAIFQVNTDGSDYDIVAQIALGGSLYDIHFADPGCGWAVGSDGAILHTTDGGQNWQMQESGLDAELSHVVALDCQNAWVSGDFEGLLHTTNGGAEWRSIELSPDHTCGAVAFPQTQDGWVVGRSEVDGSTTIFHTTDGGNTWDALDIPVPEGFLAMDFVSRQEGWTVGEKGTIWSYTDLPLHSIAGQVTYCDNDNPIEGVNLLLSGPTGDTTETDAEGFFQFTGLRQNRSFCIDPFMDDVSRQVITAFDASLVLSSLLGRHTLDACDSIAADVTGNNEITSFDVSNILRHVVGQEVAGLTGTWTFLPDQMCFSDLQSDQKNVTVHGVIYGDVSQNWPGLPGAGVPKVVVQIPPVGAAAGTQFESILFASSLTLTRLDSLDIYSYQMQIDFDPSLLQVTSISDTGLFLEGWGALFFDIDNESGRLHIAKAGTFPLPWSGNSSAPLVRIGFRVNPRASSGTSSSLNFASMIFNEGTPWAETRNGPFKVLRHSISGTVSYCSTGVAVDGLDLRISGDSTWTTLTDDTGWYVFSNLIKNRNYCVTSMALQDIPGHVITSFDAALILRYLSGSYQPGHCAALAADVNGSGTIDADDARRISQYAAGTPPSGEIGRWSFIPQEICYDALPADQTGQDYTACIFGDVSLNYPGQIPPTDRPWIFVKVPDDSVEPGATVGLAIGIDTVSTSIDDLDLYSCDLCLSYDPSVLMALLVSTEGLPTERWGAVESTIDNEKGTLRIGMASAAPLRLAATSHIPLVKVELYVNEDAQIGSESIIHVQDIIFNEDSPRTFKASGSIHITGKSISGYVRYCDSQQPVDGVSLQIFSLTTQRTTSNTSGQFVFPDLLSDRRYCVYAIDGKPLEPSQHVISSLDAALIFRHIVGLVPFSPYDSVAADVSGDRKVTAYDASIILRFLASHEIDPTFLPVSRTGNWYFEPQGRCFERLTHNETSDYSALIYGDVSQNWPGLSSPKITQPAAVSVDQVKISPRMTNRFSVPLRINNPDGILAADIEMSYDPRELKAIRATTTPATGDWELVFQSGSSGRMTIAMAGYQPPKQPGTFVEIECEAAQTMNPNQSVSIEFAVLFNEGQIPSPGIIRHSFKPCLAVPSKFELLQNVPNPFNPATEIGYTVPEDRLPLHATLKVYNILGQEVHTLLDQVQEAGYHTVTWAGTDSRGIPVSSGIYFYRLTISAVNTEHESGFSSILFTDTKRMLLLK